MVKQDPCTGNKGKAPYQSTCPQNISRAVKDNREVIFVVLDCIYCIQYNICLMLSFYRRLPGGLRVGIFVGLGVGVFEVP